MKTYIGAKLIKASPMNRLEYNEYRGWALPEDEDGADLGILVEYTDGGVANHPDHEGYISWSPVAVFEKSYKPTSAMSFGSAILMAKSGWKVARSGWNGKGMWVIYNPGSKGETHAMTEGSLYKQHGVDECEILPHFDMYTVNASGRIAMLPGWLASQSDMNSEDWCVI
tara:strand:- start:39 stop:545 length:507 start_codon:yes stop_codon:yes gene_type:complete